MIRTIEDWKKTGISFERQHTGVLYIDHLLCGGTLPGELYGILAPTGGGKTTCGVTIAVEVARGGRRSALFACDDCDSEIVPRIYTTAAGVPRADARELITLNAAAAVFEQQVAPRMHVFNRADVLQHYAGGSKAIRHILQTQVDKGQAVDVVVIDQLMSLVGAHMTAAGLNAETRRDVAVQCLEDLRDIAQTMRCAIFITHTVDSKTCAQTSATMPKIGQAADVKSFENSLHGCIQFGTRDHAGRRWLVTTKLRQDIPLRITVQLSDTHWRIDWDPNLTFCHDGCEFVCCPREDA